MYDVAIESWEVSFKYRILPIYLFIYFVIAIAIVILFDMFRFVSFSCAFRSRISGTFICASQTIWLEFKVYWNSTIYRECLHYFHHPIKFCGSFLSGFYVYMYILLYAISLMYDVKIHLNISVRFVLIQCWFLSFTTFMITKHSCDLFVVALLMMLLLLW